MLSFTTNGNFIDFKYTEDQYPFYSYLVFKLHNTSRAISWSYNDNPDIITFTVDESKYEEIPITSIYFDGVQMANQAAFKTGIEAMFPGYAGGGGGGSSTLQEVLDNGSTLDKDNEIDMAGKKLTISSEMGSGQEVEIIINPDGESSIKQYDSNDTLTLKFTPTTLKIDKNGIIKDVGTTLESVLLNSNDAAGNTIIGLANPQNPQEAATKDYVDNNVAALPYKSLVATLMQDGGATAPVITILQNGFGGSPAFTHTSVGVYSLSGVTIPDINKLWIAGHGIDANADTYVFPAVPLHNANAGQSILGYYSLVFEGSMLLLVFDASFALAELGSIIGATSKLCLPEIRVYD